MAGAYGLSWCICWWKFDFCWLRKRRTAPWCCWWCCAASPACGGLSRRPCLPCVAHSHQMCPLSLSRWRLALIELHATGRMARQALGCSEPHSAAYSAPHLEEKWKPPQLFSSMLTWYCMHALRPHVLLCAWYRLWRHTWPVCQDSYFPSLPSMKRAIRQKQQHLRACQTSFPLHTVSPSL